MSATQPDQNLLFRMRIGAINIAHPPRPGPGAVLASWPHAQDLLDLGPEWRVTDDLVLIPNGAGASHLYGAANGQDRLEVEVFVSAGGFSGAVDRLVEVAANTMMPEPPFDPAPAELRFGELAVLSTDLAHRTLVWTFRNLCLRVMTSLGGDTTAGVAGRLRDFVQAHVVEPQVVDRARPLLVLPDKPVTMRVGEILRIEPRTAGHQDTAPLILRAYPNNLVVEVRSQQPDLLVLQAREAGHTTLSVVLANAETLLCSAGRLEVTSG